MSSPSTAQAVRVRGVISFLLLLLPNRRITLSETLSRYPPPLLQAFRIVICPPSEDGDERYDEEAGINIRDKVRLRVGVIGEDGLAAISYTALISRCKLMNGHGLRWQGNCLLSRETPLHPPAATQLSVSIAATS